MATKRQRGNTWHYTVKRKGLLPRPLYLTFDSEEEGDAYIARLEQMLDRGIVPTEFANPNPSIATVGDAIRDYLANVDVTDSDARLLNALIPKKGSVRLSAVDYHWTESWVTEMKRADKLAPGTIRHHIGALARCLDRLVVKKTIPFNPLRMLPKRYSTYTKSDVEVAGTARIDVERDRRLGEGEDEAIRKIIAGAKPEGRQRPLVLNHRDSLLLLYELALETAMRMREMYSLTTDQVDLSKKTVFLDKTKNGDKRQVPLSSVAIASLKEHLPRCNGHLFPWWSGSLDEPVLRKTTSLLSQQFGRIFAAAGCADLNFHDLRHEATCRLYERTTLSDLEIAKITGHKDLRMLRRYANLRGSVLAEKLW